MSTAPMPRKRVAADTLAARLLLVRHELGISQREAAARTGVPFGVWQGMEAGRETRRLDQWIRLISDHLDYDDAWLMWGTRPKDDGDGGTSVRHEGLEPPTRWFEASAA